MTAFVLPRAAAVSRLRPAGRRVRSRHTLAALAGAVMLAVTGWIAPAAGVALLVAAGPWLLGTARAERRAAAVEEAIGRWVEAMRDLVDAGATLPDALNRTLAAAPPVIRAPLDAFAGRLAREPLDDALTALADDLADPSADPVVATLQLHTRLGSGELADVLSTLADALRAQLRVRRRVDADRAELRASTRHSAVLIVGSLAVFATLDAAFLSPLRTPRGQLALAAAVILDASALLLLRACAVFPTPPRMLADPPSRTGTAIPAVLARPAADLAHWAAPTLAARGWPTAAARADLALLGRSSDELATSQAVGAIFGATAGLLLGVAHGGLLAPAWLVLLAAAAGTWLPYQRLRRAAATRRSEFRNVLATYLDLVRTCVAGGASLAEAMWSAAAIGRGPTFAALHGALLDARTSRRSYPQALDALAATINLPELADVANTLALTDTAGAPAAATLRAQVTSLHDAELNTIRATAGRRSARMTWANVLLAAGYAVTIGYPTLAAVTATQ